MRWPLSKTACSEAGPTLLPDLTDAARSRHLWLPKTPCAGFHSLGLRRRKGFATAKGSPSNGLWPRWACENTSRRPSPLPSGATASRRGPLVPMMQPANLGQFNHPAEFRPLHNPPDEGANLVRQGRATRAFPTP